MKTQPLPRRTAAALAALATLTCTTSASVALAAEDEPERPYNEIVAVTNEGKEQLDFSSFLAGAAQAATHDGLTVVFETAAPLVPWDDNELEDVYLRDFGSDTTVLVSSRGGEVGNDLSSEPTISADGRYVAFTTWSSNLTRKDTNGSTLDVVVKDMQTDKIVLASVTNAGRQKDGHSQSPVISDDGTSVSFQSHGQLAGTDDDRHEDVYVRDLDVRRTHHVSLLPNGKDLKGHVGTGDISSTGDVVVFGNPNNLWWRDVPEDRTARIWHEPSEPPCQPNPVGSAGRPALSGNGRYAAFSSCALDLPGEDGHHSDIYRIKLRTGEITRVHKNGDGDSYLPSLSRSGRYVGFASDAGNLVPGDTTGMPDAFFADTETKQVLRASQAPDGSDGDSWSATTDISISGDGRTLVYTSYAHNLVAGDVHDKPKVFAWRR